MQRSAEYKHVAMSLLREIGVDQAEVTRQAAIYARQPAAARCVVQMTDNGVKVEADGSPPAKKMPLASDDEHEDDEDEADEDYDEDEDYIEDEDWDEDTRRRQ
jgi:hypothetical protein